MKVIKDSVHICCEEWKTYLIHSCRFWAQIYTALWKYSSEEIFPPMALDSDRALSTSLVQSLCRVPLFSTPWTAACKDSLTITNSRGLLKLRSIKLVMPSNHLILCCPFSSHLQSFPASGSFLVSQFFASGGQNIGVWASASDLPMNIQDWFPLV